MQYLKKYKLIIGLFVAVLGAVATMIYHQHSLSHPSTNDATVQANTIEISAQISGAVEKVFKKNYDKVKRGELLFTIDPHKLQLVVSKNRAELETTIEQVHANQEAVATSSAMLEQRQAELNNVRKSTQRTLILVQKKLLPQADKDQAISQLKIAIANVAAAESQLNEAKANLGGPTNNNAKIRAAQMNLAQSLWDLNHTRIYSPADGYLANFNLRHGDTVNAFQPLFSLIESENWWAVANFKETELAKIQIGQNAKIIIDTYPDRVFKGKVISISPASGESFSLLPAENASGNWVKVTQRIPVKISLPAAFNNVYRLGASCTVTVDETTHASR